MENYFLRPEDVAEYLDLSVSASYKVIRSLNDELTSAGYKTYSGRVSKKYFFERYGIS